MKLNGGLLNNPWGEKVVTGETRSCFKLSDAKNGMQG